MRYNIRIPSTPVNTLADTITIISGSLRSIYVCEIDLEGFELAGATMELGLFHVSNAGSGGGGAIVPQPIGTPNLTGSGPPAVAFSGTVFTTWGSSQPTLVAGDPAQNMPFNANGQRYYWATENVDDMIQVLAGGGAPGTLSLRALSGVSHVAGRIKIIE